MSVVAHDPTTGEVLSGEVIEELDAEAARALTDRINHSTVLAAQLVAEAWQGRAWKSLGYRSWEDYADAELPLLGSNSANRQVLLVGLRKVGMSTRAIAAATGLHHSTVARGVANATPDEITGTDGKQYDPSHPSRIRRSETVEFAGEAGTGDGPAASSGGPSPASDAGEAAIGDDAEREPSTVHSSPASPTSGDATAPHTVSDSDQADGAAAATENDPVTDAVNQLGRFVAILAGMDEPTAQTIYEQGIWEFALGFIADHPDELDLSDVAVAALRTRSIEFPRGMQ